MEEDMEIEEVLVVHEVDFDYEYDAPRFFDFTREETQDEAHQLDRWFESARSYPPSPFAIKLLLGGNILCGTFNVSPKSKDPNTEVLSGECDSGLGEHQAIQAGGLDREGMAKGIFSNLQCGSLLEVANQRVQSSKGLRFQSNISSDKVNMKVGKGAKPRSSTLMKPTASTLAKQYQPSQAANSRLQMLPGQVNQRTLFPLGSEGQASKRQKLERGHICKPVEAKQPVNLVHKSPKKEGIEKISHAKLRLTIPREPDLETEKRAQRMRPQNNNQMEDVMVSVRRFKARSLNRKILEAPQLPLPQKSTPRLPEFKLFHLKTLERAVHSSPSSIAPPPQPSLTQCDDSNKEMFEVGNASSVEESRNKGAQRTSSTAYTQIQDGSQFLFKAHPLNRKVLSSKGDVGVFRNDQCGTTIPIEEFKFQSDKRSRQIPPTELFNKLSLFSETRPNNGGPHSQLKSTQHPPSTHLKGSKENRFSSFPHKHGVTTILHRIEEKPLVYGGRHLQQGHHHKVATIIGTEPTTTRCLTMMRSSAIR